MAVAAAASERAEAAAGAPEEAVPASARTGASAPAAASSQTAAAAERASLALPGAPAFSADLLRRFEAARQERGAEYQPRTKHLRLDGWARFTNRLFLSTSPYLLQHAHNPVNWYPWGDEAFETARRLGCPVLLSIGYSTCHWCHVMEEESFEDLEIARFMNENYIVIKVDREELPDVDSIYMSAVQAMTGRGGWPMTVWLTPDRKPFFGGTYFPARDGDRGASTGFLTLLRKLKEVYDTQPERVSQSALQITQSIRERLEGRGSAAELPSAKILRDAAGFYQGRFDAANGGLQGAPKFPSSLPVRFLLRYHRRAGDRKSLDMAVLTLDRMAAGGMYDQVGGGFHRYSTDPRWLVPHFEKMLYDNALLTLAYLEGYQVTGEERFARVAREILRYVERDMTSPEDAFYSATDADSLTPSGRREEGYFFTWTPGEIVSALGEERARMVSAYYGVTARGNLEGRSILHVPRPPAEVARDLKISGERLGTIVDEAREKLYQIRSGRPTPLRDEKILTAWNGLMISAHARAALVLAEDRYAEVAARAADFVLRNLRRDGRLLRSFKDGRATHNAYLDDYAFLGAGLLDLFETTGERRWLEEAIALDQVLEAHYEDKEHGGFFMTGKDHEQLLAREKPDYDGAEPSGNSVAVPNLLRLYELTTQERYRQRAERALRAFHGTLERAPMALSEMLLAVDFYLDTPKEIVIVTAGPTEEAEPLLARLRSTFLPNRVLAVVVEGRDLRSLATLVPLVEAKVARDGKPTAYVCERRVCELPTSDPAVFERQIRKVEPL